MASGFHQEYRWYNANDTTQRGVVITITDYLTVRPHQPSVRDRRSKAGDSCAILFCLLCIAAALTPLFYIAIGIYCVVAAVRVPAQTLSITTYCGGYAEFKAEAIYSSDTFHGLRVKEIILGSTFIAACVCCVLPCIILLITDLKHLPRRCMAVVYIAVLGGYIGGAGWWIHSYPLCPSDIRDCDAYACFDTSYKLDPPTTLCNVTRYLDSTGRNAQVFGPLDGVWYTGEQYKLRCNLTKIMIACCVGSSSLVIASCVALLYLSKEDRIWETS